MKWIFAKRLATVALLIFGLAVVADITVFSFVEYGRKSADYVGCFAYDAMLVGFDCQGFPASSLVSAWPLWLLYAPIFAFFSIKAASIAVLVWFPLILYVVAARKVARENA